MWHKKPVYIWVYIKKIYNNLKNILKRPLFKFSRFWDIFKLQVKQPELWDKISPLNTIINIKAFITNTVLLLKLTSVLLSKHLQITVMKSEVFSQNCFILNHLQNHYEYIVPYLWGARVTDGKSLGESTAPLDAWMSLLAPPSQSSTHSALVTDRSPEPHPSCPGGVSECEGRGLGSSPQTRPLMDRAAAASPAFSSVIIGELYHIISRPSAVDLYSTIKRFPALKHASDYSQLKL